MLLRLSSLLAPRARSPAIFWAAVVPLLLAAALALGAAASIATARPGATNCDAVLKTGRYLDANSFEPKAWQPDGCALHSYRHQSIFSSMRACLAPGDEIIVAGGRAARAVFYGMLNELKPGYYDNIETTTKTTGTASHDGVQLRLLWSPLLDGAGADQLIDIAKHGLDSQHKTSAVEAANRAGNKAPLKTYLFVTAGAEFLTSNNLQGFSSNVKRIADAVASSSHFEKAYFAPIMIPYYSRLEGKDAAAVTPEKVAKLIQFSDRYFNYDPVAHTGGVLYGNKQNTKNTPAMYYVPVFNNLGSLQHLELYRPDTMSYIDETRFLQASILLNHMCNERLANSTSTTASGAEFPFTGTCCVSRPGVSPAAGLAAAAAVVLIIVAGIALRAAPSSNQVSARAAAILGAGGVAACYVYAAERTHAFSKVDIVYSPASVLLLLQAVVYGAVLRVEPAVEPALTASRKNEFARRASFVFIHELQGLCLLLLLAMQVSGYDVVHERFEGALFARVLYSCWAAAAVYDFACGYMALLCDARRGESRYAPIKYCLLHTARVLFLPLLLLAVVHSDTATVSQSLARVSPISVKLLFWYLFVALATPLTLAATGYTLRIVSGLVQSKPAAVLAQYTIFVLVTVLVYFLRRAMVLSNEEPAGIIFDYQQEHPVLADFWVVFAAVFAAWWYYSAEFVHDSPSSEKQVVSTGPSLRVALYAGMALGALISALYRAFRYPLTNLVGSSVVAASTDFSPKFYALSLAERGAGYTPLVHWAVCVAVVALWVVMRAGVLAHTSTGPQHYYYYSSLCVFVSACSYEMLVLRRHILQSTFGHHLLALLPAGLGAVRSSLVDKTMQALAGPVNIPYRMYSVDFGLLARYWLNLALVFGVFVCVAKACSAGWDLLVDSEERPVESEKSVEC